MLNHDFYEIGKSYILIEREIQSIVQYLSFTQARIQDRDAIGLYIETDNKGQRIKRRLLLSFLVSAVNAMNTDCEPWIMVILIVKGNWLMFECASSSATHSNITRPGYYGRQLKNLKRRLDLCYAGRHKLLIKLHENVFNVSLKINLT